MNRVLSALLLSLWCLFSFAQTNYYGRTRTFKLSAGVTAADYQANTVIVKFKGDRSAHAESVSVVPSVKLKAATVMSIAPKLLSSLRSQSLSTTGILMGDGIGLNRIYKLRYSGTVSIEKVINELLTDKRVEYAEPSYVNHLYYEPNDPDYRPRQSYLTQVKAPEAWNLIRNSAGIIIGIVDSGSELTHEDLAENIVGGWDFVGASASNPSADDDPNVVQAANDHGVHVSGLASAASDNGKGVASIASNAGLLIVKVAADDDAEDILEGYDGIKYAADHGAHIINCSWGSTNRSFYGEDIINYAMSKGCLIVAAAGNNGSNVPEYPAAYRGVMAVANVEDNDVKSASSNYGGYVALSAPGNHIYSTTFGNTYGYKSGTSMASPVVASAAALVKSYRRDLSMQQVGQLLRVTADNLDAVNPSFTGQLGKGRLNVFRALTENSPSVRYADVSVEDDHGGSLLAGAPADIYLDVENLLSPASDLEIILKSDDPHVRITSGTRNISTLNTLDKKTRIGPFRIFINEGTPDNSPVTFTITYSANHGSYQDYETFTLVVARDYLNIQTDYIATTATTTGRIGYSSANRQGGQGFQYKGISLLYEAGLLIGASPALVSNNVRSAAGSADEHFIKKMNLSESLTDSVVTVTSGFNDQGNSAALNIDVSHHVVMRRKSPDNKFVVAEVEVTNRNSTELNGIYIGMFTDWDIDDESSNITRFVASDRIAYTCSAKNSQAPYAGVKLLSTNAPIAYYPMTLSASPLNDGNFTIAEKYETLSSGVVTPSQNSGDDVSFVSGYGPYRIAAGGSVKVAFALGAGDSYEDLLSNLMQAQGLYDRAALVLTSAPGLLSYPNPVTWANSNRATAVVHLPDAGMVSLDLYNMLGQRVKTIVSHQLYEKGEHQLSYSVSDMESGIYLLRLQYNNKIQTYKVSVIR